MNREVRPVIVFGTFDLVHHGHENFFKQALKLGQPLYVIIARRANVYKIKKHYPKLSERQRLAGVKKVLAGKPALVILGSQSDPYQAIRKFQPKIIALGYDQKSFDQKLEKVFPQIKIVRLKAFKPKIYKSSIINQKSC